ncbi:jg10861 [Pararge aegeria aegeria]|uniref:Jg10861 protein n=1 Tax=Pararge aegeria aegeria TaxID=348720 RepID=A0A8S4QWF5_9NEOP|nr:jg10861 [Pararge aegeria aegeria]
MQIGDLVPRLRATARHPEPGPASLLLGKPSLRQHGCRRSSHIQHRTVEWERLAAPRGLGASQAGTCPYAILLYSNRLFIFRRQVIR